jgi:ethanolamine-phosphate cytidylyltransferase
LPKLTISSHQRGDYLIAGIHGDAIVNKHMGINFPLLNLHERVLSVLGCRYVDDVLIDAPYEITRDMISSLNISEVVHGTMCDDIENVSDEENRYRHAKEAGIFSVIKSPSDFRLENIVQRIHQNQEKFQEKFKRKQKAESDHYKQKYGKIESKGQ